MKININKDVALRLELISMINDNKGYCCCKVEHTPENKCMCKEFRDKIDRKELGFCQCGLYQITET